MKTRVTVWHEQELRKLSSRNSKMKYLNVQLYGLSGRPHPALLKVFSTQDSKKLRLHLKFLTSDYITDEKLSWTQPSTSTPCSLCGTAADCSITYNVPVQSGTLNFYFKPKD